MENLLLIIYKAFAVWRYSANCSSVLSFQIIARMHAAAKLLLAEVIWITDGNSSNNIIKFFHHNFYLYFYVNSFQNIITAI